jgi:hypothetical protein
MYTKGMDPQKGPVKLTQAQVAAQNAAARTIPRSQTPVSGSSDDDDPNGSEFVWSKTKSCMRRNKHFRKAATDISKTSVPALVSIPEPTRQPAPVSVPADTPSPKGTRPVTKAAASQKAPAAQKPVSGAKASKPAKTRRQAASRAGGLRSVGGSGQTDTCVAQGNPSKT